jgi:hypothetical protein
VKQQKSGKKNPVSLKAKPDRQVFSGIYKAPASCGKSAQGKYTHLPRQQQRAAVSPVLQIRKIPERGRNLKIWRGFCIDLVRFIEILKKRTTSSHF